MRGCICLPSRRRWTPDGRCATCSARVSESQIQTAIRLAVGRIPGLVLWRNEQGHNTHWPDGRKREHPIEYGVGHPGGADLIGCYRGAFVALEVKTPDGVQSSDQRVFAGCVERNQGHYLMPRSVEEAVEMISELSRRLP